MTERRSAAEAGDFTLGGYRALIEAFAARGYAVRSFADAAPNVPDLILRHDLDMSIEAAIPIATIEAELGVRASYFVLLRSELYNPQSAAATAALDRLAGMGHEIGLHFDTAHYGDDPDALDTAAARECDILERIIGRPVATISLHRPAERLLGLDRTLGGRPHTYAPRYFRDVGYCSDSRGRWGHGHPLAHPALRDGRALQLLTHPIWWVGEGEPARRLDALLARRMHALDYHLAEHCEVHRAGRRAGGYR